MTYRNSDDLCPAGSVPYTVRSGDTLRNIAFLYNALVQDIVQFNPGIDPNILVVGQQICIPIKIQMYPSCPTTNYYVVAQGDTINSIAKSFNITPRQLLYSNYGIEPNDLYLDQVLCIPVAPPVVNIEINVVERKLDVYLYGNLFKTYIIGLENSYDPVPRGTFKVINKQVDPGEERGARWLGLSQPGFGIQGTNNPQFIQNISKGNSIVLSNQDINELFNLIPVVTTVKIQ